jgi:hypothetical protein
VCSPLPWVHVFYGAIYVTIATAVIIVIATTTHVISDIHHAHTAAAIGFTSAMLLVLLLMLLADCLWFDGVPINSHVFTSTTSIAGSTFITSATTCLPTKREEPPVLATMSARKKYYYVVGVGVVELAIMQHPSDCHIQNLHEQLCDLAQVLSKSPAM